MSNVLVINGADFSKNKIENVNVIGGKKIQLSNVELDKYLAVQTGTPVETVLNHWKTTDFITIDSVFSNINGISNFYNDKSIITGMVCFYEENKSFISYSNDFKKHIAAAGPVHKVFFNTSIPTNAKYVRFCWEYANDAAAINTPEIYYR